MNTMITPIPGSFGSLGAITGTTGGAYPAGGDNPYGTVNEDPLDSTPSPAINKSLPSQVPALQQPPQVSLAGGQQT